MRRRDFGGEAPPVAAGVVDELRAAVGAARSKALAARLATASQSYERDRYLDARRILSGLVALAPDVAAVRELYGLTLYRMGQWRESVRQLVAYGELSGSSDQLAVMADCWRALGRHDRVVETLEELRRASPGADVAMEARLVLAGSLADQGDLAGAIAALEPYGRVLRHPAQRHLRLWFALADLYERSGDLARARQLFGEVADRDPDLGRAGERLRNLR